MALFDLYVDLYGSFWSLWLFLIFMALFDLYGSFLSLWLFFIFMALFDLCGSFCSLWLFLIFVALFYLCGSFLSLWLFLIFLIFMTFFSLWLFLYLYLYIYNQLIAAITSVQLWRSVKTTDNLVFVNSKKDLFHNRQQEKIVVQSLNNIEGLPYIIIQSGLPSTSNGLWFWIFPKEDEKRQLQTLTQDCDIEGLPYMIIQSGLPSNPVMGK